MEQEKPAIILIMRATPERAQLAAILERFAKVVALHTKKGVLTYVKNTPTAEISMFIGDFSDLEIDAWDILEPLKIVMCETPLYVIAAENDTSYQEMLTSRVAGVFTRPISLQTLTATIEMELMMRPEQRIAAGTAVADGFDVPVEIRAVANRAATSSGQPPRPPEADELHRQLTAFAGSLATLEKLANDFYQAQGGTGERQATEKFADFNRELNDLVEKYQKDSHPEGDR